MLTPDTFVRAPIPGMSRATAIVHAGPAIGAAFTQYTAEFEAGGSLAPAQSQRFVFVLEGELTHGERKVPPRSYLYLPDQNDTPIRAEGPSRALVIEKPYQHLSGHEAPPPLLGEEAAIAPQPLLGDEAIQVRCLLPDHAGLDFAVNTMTFLPGASLPMVESHIMEHGLLMLSGGGIYRLGESWYPVTAGDFIWMAPYCPQWFGALGKQPAKYIIYKNWNRHPLA